MSRCDHNAAVLASLDLHYPEVDDRQREELAAARQLLEAEA